MGAAFIALKLLPTSESGDIEPLAMRFAGGTPSIPIVPTSGCDAGHGYARPLFRHKQSGANQLPARGDQ